MSAALIMYLIGVLLGVVGPLLPRFASGHSTLLAGMVMAGHPLGCLLAAIPTIFAARRYGQPKVIVAGALLLATATSLFLLPGGAWPAFAARVGQGAAAAVLWQSVFSWAFTASGPSRRGRTIGILLTAQTLGGLTGPLLGALGETYGFWLFLVPALATVAVSFYFLTLPSFPLSERTSLAAFRRALGTRVGIAGIALGGVFPVAQIALTTKLPLLLSSAGMSAFGIGAILTANSAIGAATMPLFGRLIDRGYKRKLVGVSALISTGTIICLILFVHSLPLIIGFALASLAALGGLNLPASLLISRAMDKGGLDQMVGQAICSLIWAPNAIFGSMLIGLIPSASVAFALVAAAVFAVVLALAADRVHRRSHPRSRPRCA